MSSWNFDLAALKAQAAMEPDDDVPPLPTIREDETDTLTGATAEGVAAFVAASQAGGLMSFPVDISRADTPPLGPARSDSRPPLMSAFGELGGREGGTWDVGHIWWASGPVGGAVQLGSRGCLMLFMLPGTAAQCCGRAVHKRSAPLSWSGTTDAWILIA